MLRVLLRFTSHSSLCFQPNQSRLYFNIITYNCLVEIELHREIYHFTHERQPLKLDSNQHSAISRSFYHLNYLSYEVSVFPDCHLGQRTGRTTKNQNARIAATPKSVTGTQYHLVRLLGVRAQNQIRNPIAARDRTAATIIGNIWKSLLLLKCVPNSFSRDYRLGTASANQITEVLG